MFFSKKPKRKLDILAQMLTSKSGCRSYEIMKKLPTVCPHRRLTDLKNEGWTITTKEDKKNKCKIYFGKPPKTV